MWPFGSRNRPPRKALTAVPARRAAAKYDAAQTTADNRRHWANADGLSATAAGSVAVRKTLRNRARYEVANNSYAAGIMATLANDVVGTGPRLQMGTASNDINRIRETLFASWAKAVGLAEKLRTMRLARAQDGEAFMLLTTNPDLRHSIKLFPVVIEADQIASPNLMQNLLQLSGDIVDGITFDSNGEPKTYTMLDKHPGAAAALISRTFTEIPAASMIHWFKKGRPGQRRGISELTPALPLFAQLRRYTLAVIGAAEAVADIAVVMKTTMPSGEEAAEVEPMTEIEYAARMATFMPEGWEPFQIKAEQPSTTYADFKKEILNEIARCIPMPYNVAVGNSAGYNYASGRLDKQAYYKFIRVDQSSAEAVVLDPLLRAFAEEASKVYAFIDKQYAWPHQWFWDGTEHVDPVKEAVAQSKRLESNTTTLATEYARNGKDWETELEQIARERKRMKALGLVPADVEPAEAGTGRSGDGQS